MVECFAACPDHLHVQLPTHPTDVVIRQLEAEADEMWSFVKRKADKQWTWIAMEAKTHQVIAFHVGDRSRDSTKALWANIPELYREQATFHTDQQVFHMSLQSHESYSITCVALPSLRCCYYGGRDG